MRIVHRFSLNAGHDDLVELAGFGLIVQGSSFVTFEVEEANPIWPVIEAWAAERRAVDLTRTEFPTEEIAAAEWLALSPEWHHGYPQPDEEAFGYLRTTYELAEYCAACGTGLKQKAPFQMRAEPRWGRRGILQLNWVFGEYFVRPEVWESVFKPRGVGSRPVMNTRGTRLRSVVQLQTTEETGVLTANLAGTQCPTCGRTKYLPITRGMFPPLVGVPSGDLIRTEQEFGSGAVAFKPVLISKEIFRGLRTHNIRDVAVVPVCESEE